MHVSVVKEKATEDLGTVRLDKWLWATRFYKTRSLAGGAISGGKVQVNGDRVKRSKLIHIGDKVRIRKGPYEYELVVQAISERRGPASEAQRLYKETPESKLARERMAEAIKMQPSTKYVGKGRPTKKDRRRIIRFKRKR